MTDRDTEIEELKRKVADLEEKLTDERIFNKEYYRKIKTVYDLIYESGEIEDRAVLDDLQLLRELYVRFKSFRFIVGVVFGALTVVVPVALGVIKLFQLLGEWIKS